MSSSSTQLDRQFLYEKYIHLIRYVDRLEPTYVASIFKDYKGPNTFYPQIGLFFSEFAVAYCFNLHQSNINK